MMSRSVESECEEEREKGGETMMTSSAYIHMFVLYVSKEG